MAKTFDPRRLDVRRFAEESGELSGDSLVSAYERLQGETDRRGADAPVRWSAQGELRNAGHVRPDVWLHLEAEARVPLVCQRCLGPVEVDLEVDRSFRFVADEATAAAEDDEAEEDVLAESRQFDLQELIEDELLMALPVAPRHDVCPELPRFAVEDEGFEQAAEEKKNPFAVLQGLKKH